jgi:ABC-2 type transport system permease protein
MLSAIYVMWLRQIKKYFRSRARLIGSLGQPLLFLLAFWFGFGPIYAKAGGGNYLNFLAPGIIAMGIIFAGIFTGIEVIWDRRFGFLKETLVAPVPRIEIFIGRILGGATVSLIQGMLVLIISLIVGFRPASLLMLPVAMLIMFMTGMLFTAVGTAIASFLEDMQAFSVIINFLIMPLFFLSGALFPLAGLPASIAMISRFDPLSYGVDGLRATLTLTSHFGLAVDFFVLLGCIAVMSVIGAFFFSRIEV